MKVVKKILIGVLILVVLLIALVACIGSDDSSELTPEQIESSENADMYKGMLSNLDEAFNEKTETLIKEFENESVYIAGDQEAIKELGDSKVKELAEMCASNKKVLERQVSDHGDSDEVYEYWAEKLDDIYKDYAVQIMSLYE